MLLYSILKYHANWITKIYLKKYWQGIEAQIEFSHFNSAAEICLNEPEEVAQKMQNKTERKKTVLKFKLTMNICSCAINWESFEWYHNFIN